MLLPSSNGSPGAQACARTFPVIAAANGKFTSYPPKDEDGDEQLLYTYASFNEEPIAALCVNKRHEDTWSLCIEVPIPKINNPTLLALRYMIKYAATCDNGNSTVQTDTLLTSEVLPQGVVTEEIDTIYYQDESETGSTNFSPRMVDHEEALCLSTTLAVKSNGGCDQWSHYIDNQYITPNVRVIDDCHLYVVFHVNEYPTAHTIRSLAVKVSATWQKEEVELKAIAEAERKAREEAMKQEQLEKERRAREAEERQARKEEREAREEERHARREEHQAREQEHQARKEEHRAREEERQARIEERQAREEERQARLEDKQDREANSVESAPAVADDRIQTRIEDKMEALGLELCEQGFKFKKTSYGYECTGGAHKISFAQLGMK